MSRKDEAMAASNLALRLVAEGNVAAGLALHRRAVAADPEDWRWQFSLLGSLLNRGHVDEADERKGGPLSLGMSGVGGDVAVEADN